MTGQECMAKEKSIETYLNELKQINEALTQENLRMDEALRLYEQGVVLVREAEKLMEHYTQQVEIIEAESK